MIQLSPEIQRQLKNAQYRIFNHSGVQICKWTREALRSGRVCYKQKFYGIDCHRCMQFSPAVVFCEQKCIFCWRPMEFMKKISMREEEVDEPKEIIEKLTEARRDLLSGYGGYEKIDMEKYEEALIPNHFAISLMGEPTLYPKLPEMILFLRSLPQTKSIFLVSNGQEPQMLEKLDERNALPTQLYLSVNAPNEKLFKKINLPLYKDAWLRFKKSLEFLSEVKTRTVVRMTMIKGLNMDEKFMREYAELMQLTNPHFIEIKAYMHLGFSRKRLKRENMPMHEEIKQYTENFLKFLKGFEVMDESRSSNIVVLRNKERKIDRWIKESSSKI